MLTLIAEWVAGTSFAAWAAGSAYAYPVANIVHVLALVLLLGGIGLVDLRLLGAFRSLPLVPLARALTPLAMAGLVLLLTSGAVLFAADAAALPLSETFGLKLLLIGLALANAALFRWRFRSLPDAPGLAARAMALASLLLWTSVTVSGRMIAYS